MCATDRAGRTLEWLPPEVVLSILGHLPARDLGRASLVSRTLSALAQHALFRAPEIRTLEQLSALLRAIEQGQHRPRPVGSEDDDPHRALAVKLRELTVSCREVGSKGWGPRIGKVLRLCTRLSTLSLDGVPDLRIKHLVGCGALRSLSLVSSTFRSHSLPTSPHLPETLAALSALSLINLGLPPESTHFSSLLVACASSVHHLSLGYLRDVEPTVFLDGLSHLTQLRQLHLGVLTEPQRSILSSALAALSSLQTVVFDGTLPTAAHLVALPPSVSIVRFPTRPNEKGSEELVQVVCEALGTGRIRWTRIDMWRELLANVAIERAAGGARSRRGESSEGVRVNIVDGFRVQVFI